MIEKAYSCQRYMGSDNWEYMEISEQESNNVYMIFRNIILQMQIRLLQFGGNGEPNI